MNGLLKFITCGSVDDGKSTLIGHILHDAKLLYTDQEKTLMLDSKVGSRGGKIDYSLLLDGLMAEREQGITIDVAYRYFTTDKRSFIVADTPGHEEYTRNMAVGASFAQLAIILLDATQGVLVQTRRHAYICHLMGIQHFVFAVNKMDLAGYSEETFHDISRQIDELVEELSLPHVVKIPVSATEGDNVTVRSEHMPWYNGPVLLEHLENVDVNEKHDGESFMMPVQRVCRPDHTFRGFQGQIEAGALSVGDTIRTLPSGETADVRSILVGDKQVDRAVIGQPVTIQLSKEVDVSRGCVLTASETLGLADKVQVTLLWMDDDHLVLGKDYLLKLGTKRVAATVTRILYTVDVNTGEHRDAQSITKNEIACCELTFTEKIAVEPFAQNKALGGLILIDRVTHMTSACGVVEQLLTGGEAPYFEANGVRLSGSAFEPSVYHLASGLVKTISQREQPFTVGDAVPLSGKGYQYPADFDLLNVIEQGAVQVRDGKIAAVLPLSQYSYSGKPVTDTNGIGLEIADSAALEAFRKAYAADAAAAYNQYAKFEAWRKIIFD